MDGEQQHERKGGYDQIPHGEVQPADPEPGVIRHAGSGGNGRGSVHAVSLLHRRSRREAGGVERYDAVGGDGGIDECHGLGTAVHHVHGTFRLEFGDSEAAHEPERDGVL